MDASVTHCGRLFRALAGEIAAERDLEQVHLKMTSATIRYLF